MSDLNELDSTNKSNSVENDILNFIKGSRYGYNISQIAKELKMSRNTVKTNVELLKEEGKIEIKCIGKSRICYYRQYFDGIQVFGPLVLEFIKELLNSFEETMKRHITNSEEMVKVISKNFGKNYDLPPFQLLKLDKVSNIEDFSINEVSETLVQFFTILDALGIQFEAEIVPAEVESSRTIRLQVFSNEIGQSISFYHMIAGYLESKLNIQYKKKISLDVIEFREESSLCYFTLKMED